MCGFTLIETDSRVMEIMLSEEMNVPPLTVLVLSSYLPQPGSNSEVVTHYAADCVALNSPHCWELGIKSKQEVDFFFKKKKRSVMCLRTRPEVWEPEVGGMEVLEPPLEDRLTLCDSTSG